MTTSVDAIVEALQERADDERALFGAGYHATAEEILGTTTPDWRGVAKKVVKAVPKPDQSALVDQLLQTGVFEARLVAYHLSRYHPATWNAVTPARVEELRQGLDNWVTVDTFGCSVTGHLWLKNRFPDATVEQWTRDDDRWVRRLALVTTVPLNKKTHGGRGDSARTLHICEQLVVDRDDMVVKAVSWALRELVRWDRAAVEDFLLVHDVAPRVRREVRKKLDTGRKNG